MKKHLFVCHGNVGRSQIAEAFFNKYCSKNSVAFSAGVDQLTPKKYSKPTEEVILVMKEEGIDVTGKKVKYIESQMVEEADLVIVMCEKKLCPRFLIESNKVVYWDIEDPYNSSINNFRKIRDQIKEKVKGLLLSEF